MDGTEHVQRVAMGVPEWILVPNHNFFLSVNDNCKLLYLRFEELVINAKECHDRHAHFLQQPVDTVDMPVILTCTLLQNHGQVLHREETLTFEVDGSQSNELGTNIGKLRVNS